MSIIRAPRPDSGFYTLDKRISEDARLSWAARGLLIFLLGKPDHWEVSVEHLRKQTEDARIKTGRDGVYALLDELITVGYVRREQTRLPGGTMGPITYLVSEDPHRAEPLPAKPLPAQPDPVETTQVKTDTQQELSLSNQLIAPSPAGAGSALVVGSGIGLPTNTGAEVVPTEADIAEYAALYPAVDVEGELRKMRGWLLGNPSNRKTAKGMPRFIHNWLSRAQDRAPRQPQQGAFPMPQSKTGQGIAALEALKQRARGGL